LSSLLIILYDGAKPALLLKNKKRSD